MPPDRRTSTGICLVRVTRWSSKEVLITVTTNSDVSRRSGQTSWTGLDVDAAVALVSQFLREWQSVREQ